ncbi:MAG: low molecular weight phosphotyrosine protein phosphatase [Pirellulaceae bacterium]|nr:low molecular weight phosphotyrosine protein phosphatase [Pirellulaceae bacterium]
MSESRSILFVCMGNICRSPAADGLLLDFIRKNQRSSEIQLHVDSAGTHSYHVGEPADARMRQAASRRGFDLQSRARRVTAKDLHAFDFVLAMDRENLTAIQALGDGLVPEATATIALFSDYLDDSWPTDVPDPYYGGEDGFEYVLEMIETACPRIYAALTSVQA